jgi:tRNA (guanine37-N1)-methyltransferase
VRIGIVTLFPEMFKALTQFGVTGRAVRNGLLSVEFFNPRDYATDNYQTVDDRPFGGGPGMLMKFDTLKHAIQRARECIGEDARVIYMSPQGEKLTQSAVKDFARLSNLVIIAGRYEGIDERIISSYVNEEWSIGDYVLSGGELPAMVMIDAVSRLIPGVLGDELSAKYDSFTDGILDYPQYTRPECAGGLDVPEVLLQGCHEDIAQWRLKEALGRTYVRRRDLIKNLALTDGQEKQLAMYIRESDSQKK